MIVLVIPVGGIRALSEVIESDIFLSLLNDACCEGASETLPDRLPALVHKLLLHPPVPPLCLAAASTALRVFSAAWLRLLLVLVLSPRLLENNPLTLLLTGVAAPLPGPPRGGPSPLGDAMLCPAEEDVAGAFPEEETLSAGLRVKGTCNRDEAGADSALGPTVPPEDEAAIAVAAWLIIFALVTSSAVGGGAAGSPSFSRSRSTA